MAVSVTIELNGCWIAQRAAIIESYLSRKKCRHRQGCCSAVLRCHGRARARHGAGTAIASHLRGRCNGNPEKNKDGTDKANTHEPPPMLRCRPAGAMIYAECLRITRQAVFLQTIPFPCLP